MRLSTVEIHFFFLLKSPILSEMTLSSEEYVKTGTTATHLLVFYPGTVQSPGSCQTSVTMNNSLLLIRVHCCCSISCSVLQSIMTNYKKILFFIFL